MVQNGTEVLAGSFQQIWGGITAFLPSFLGAMIIFFFGLLVATLFSSLVERAVKALHAEKWLASLRPYLERAGVTFDIARFFGQLTFWFFLGVFLLAASDTLGLAAFSDFLRDVLQFLPHVFIAVMIMIAAILLGNFLRGVVQASAKSAKLRGANFLGSLAWWSVLVFAFFAALIELGVAVSLLNTLITGFVAMLALAGGISFGLGGKDLAAEILGKLKEQVEHRER